MKLFQRLVAFLTLFLIAAHALGAPYHILYVVQPMPPANGEEARTHVRIIVTGVKPDPMVRFQMASWSPGDYHVMNHWKYVKNTEAHTPGVTDIAGQGFVIKAERGHKAEPLEFTQPDDNTWQVRTNGADGVELEYDLPNEPAGFFSDNVKVTESYAFYNGPATYMYVAGHKTDPASLRIQLPKGWSKAITPLDSTPATEVEADQVGFEAPDFDTLADSPVVAGTYETRGFEFAGRPHRLVFFDRTDGTNFDGFLPPIQKLVAEENRLMGGPPYKRYDVFVDVGGHGGGLEHLNSHRIGWPRGADPRFSGSLVAHEFFHLWNVKRIRPAVLGPFDYVNPPKTRNLWFCEGVTEYYAELSQLRAGLMDQNGYLGQQAREIQSLQSTPARQRVTADESSLRVWEANNSSGYGGLDYYLKGELIGLCLDLQLRGITNGRSNLDDVMRDLLARYGIPKPGYPEDGIREAVIRAGGSSMGPFYDRLARSTEEMPFQQCLKWAGLRLVGDRSYEIEMDLNAAPSALALRNAWLTGR